MLFLDIDKLKMGDYIAKQVSYEKFIIGRIISKEKIPIEIINCEIQSSNEIFINGEWVSSKTLPKNKNECIKLFEGVKLLKDFNFNNINIGEGWMPTDGFFKYE